MRVQDLLAKIKDGRVLNAGIRLDSEETALLDAYLRTLADTADAARESAQRYKEAAYAKTYGATEKDIQNAMGLPEPFGSFHVMAKSDHALKMFIRNNPSADEYSVLLDIVKSRGTTISRAGFKALDDALTFIKENLK